MTDLFGAVQDPPWDENPPIVAPEIEDWVTALCIAQGGKPDKLFGDPVWPRWVHTTNTLSITPQSFGVRVF